jgi:UDP-N-acetyl-2-amino-2-deoxyglucuronate dehydrogenase
VKTYRVAIVGCRARGTATGRAYAAHPRTDVVALCDLLPERVDALGDELGVMARFADLEAMIVETKPDIVAIPTGTELHFPLAMRVLEHGVNVDVEKPIGVDLSQADAMVAKATEKGVLLAVHHQWRVGCQMRAVRRAVAEGAIGAVHGAIAQCKGYYGGFGLMDIGTHVVNNLEAIFGPCRRVYATASTEGHPITPEDVVVAPAGMGVIAGEHITASLQFDGGLTATVLHHRLDKVYGAGTTELLGTSGRIAFQSGAAWRVDQPHRAPVGADQPWQPLPSEEPPQLDRRFGAQPDDVWYVDELVRALDERREHECGGANGRRVLEVLMAVLESAAYGRPVAVPQEPPARREHPLLRWRREHGLGHPPPVPRAYSEWLAAEDRRLGRQGTAGQSQLSGHWHATAGRGSAGT